MGNVADLNNIAKAHEELYRYIRNKYPGAPVGISHNSAVFKPRNLAGRIPAAIFDWCFMSYPVSLFRSLDFFGLSYYARIDFDPRKYYCCTCCIESSESNRYIHPLYDCNICSYHGCYVHCFLQAKDQCLSTGNTCLGRRYICSYSVACALPDHSKY